MIRKGIILIGLICIVAGGLNAQKNVLTFGIQLKPIIPSNTFKTKEQFIEQNGISFSLEQRPSMCFGMVIRRGITKTLSVESGINLLRRNFDLTINHPDSSHISESDFRLLNYEVPVLALVYIRLSDNLYMNAAGGVSFDMYPSNLFTFGETFNNKVFRYHWFHTSVLTNLGWEYRTRESGYFYLGASFHRPFGDIMKSEVNYNGFGQDETAEFMLDGSYLTLDIRYFFHEDEIRKKRKLKKPKKPKKKK